MLPPSERNRVLIVDDSEAVSKALAALISTLPEFEVCGMASTVAEAMIVQQKTKPDIAIIDISLKDGDGIDLIKRIIAADEKVRILVWSLHGEYAYAEAAIHAGALGYITKDRAISCITEALQRIAMGQSYLSPFLEEKLHTATGDHLKKSLQAASGDKLKEAGN